MGKETTSITIVNSTFGNGVRIGNQDVVVQDDDPDA